MYLYLKEDLKTVLGTKYGYDIASAIRGPDADPSVSKSIFTARIRALANAMSVGEYRASSMFSVNWLDILHDYYALVQRKSDYSNIFTLQHFNGHVGSALDALHELGMIAGREYSFLTELLDLNFSVNDVKQKYSEFLEDFTVSKAGQIIDEEDFEDDADDFGCEGESDDGWEEEEE